MLFYHVMENYLPRLASDNGSLFKRLRQVWMLFQRVLMKRYITLFQQDESMRPEETCFLTDAIVHKILFLQRNGLLSDKGILQANL